MQLSLKKAAQDKFIRQLSNYNNDLATKWQTLIDKLERSKNVVVANAGLFKAGKSSLFNALFESIETERFPTGAAPVTHTLDQQEWHDDILLIDTPGIGTDFIDEQKAIQSYRMADMILFVHNMRMGDYQREEIDFIIKICHELGTSSNISEVFLFVGSRLDEVQGTKDETEILRRMQEQLTQIFGHKMPIYVESATRYLKGRRERKDGLVRSSGFSELRKEILRHSKIIKLHKNKFLGHEFSMLQQDTINTLKLQRDAVYQEIQRAEMSKRGELMDMLSSLNTFWDNYQERLNMILHKQRMSS
ncbi:hypothetical protein TI05_05925 [Achromatium sp. WMS3]|nr:hypothetical protein TI05_05925 [Achromatium sp. WMS3]